MRNSLFQRIAGIGLAAFVAFGTASCGSAPSQNTGTTQNIDKNDEGTQNSEAIKYDTDDKSDDITKDKEDTKTAESPDNSSDSEFEPVRQSFSDEKEVLKYLAGEWSYIYPKTGRAYATLAIEDDGTVTLTRDYDKALCNGRLSFKKNNNAAPGPDEFYLELNNIEGFLPGNENDQKAVNAESRGDFYIGTGSGSDYFYLEEIGNGDTYISRNVLNPYYYEQDTNTQTRWLFTRKNDMQKELSPAQNRKFYGFAWQSESDGLFLQDMNALETEEYEDYSDRQCVQRGRFR